MSDDLNKMQRAAVPINGTGKVEYKFERKLIYPCDENGITKAICPVMEPTTIPTPGNADKTLISVTTFFIECDPKCRWWNPDAQECKAAKGDAR